MSPLYGTMGLAMEMLEDAHERQSKCYLKMYEIIEGVPIRKLLSLTHHIDVGAVGT